MMLQPKLLLPPAITVSECRGKSGKSALRSDSDMSRAAVKQNLRCNFAQHNQISTPGPSRCQNPCISLQTTIFCLRLHFANDIRCIRHLLGLDGHISLRLNKSISPEADPAAACPRSSRLKSKSKSLHPVCWTLKWEAARFMRTRSCGSKWEIRGPLFPVVETPTSQSSESSQLPLPWKQPDAFFFFQ